MVPRGYVKSRELPQKKDMFPQRKPGDYFDDHLKDNQFICSLGKYGEKLINTFKKQNEKMEKNLRNKEELLWEYRHSKPPLYLNPWKSNLHVKEEFSKSPADKVHSFRVERKKKFLITDPFRIPKKDGDYFYERPSNAINHFYLL